MTQSAKDRILLALLPAILTAGVYMWGYGRPLQRSFDASRTKLAAFNDDVSALALARKKQSIEELSDKVAEAKELAARLSLGSKSLLFGSDSRAKALANLSSVVTSKGMMLVKSAPEKESRDSGKEIEILGKKQHLPAPQFWRLELIGTYQQMWETLQLISASPDFVIPIGIEMNANAKEPDFSDDPQKKWALTLWI